MTLWMELELEALTLQPIRGGLFKCPVWSWCPGGHEGSLRSLYPHLYNHIGELPSLPNPNPTKQEGPSPSPSPQSMIKRHRYQNEELGKAAAALDLRVPWGWGQGGASPA